jgi:hypothetical protein
LNKDCLCYLSYKGNPVKAARVFAGYVHEQAIIRLAAHFNQPMAYFETMLYDAGIDHELKLSEEILHSDQAQDPLGIRQFLSRDLAQFKTPQQAYHRLVADIILQQACSTALVIKGTAIKKIFVDGGFSRNEIYMSLLAVAFSDISVYAATLPQASALGAAMIVHDIDWQQEEPVHFSDMKLYKSNLPESI